MQHLRNDIIARTVAKPKVHGVAPSTIPRMWNRAAIKWYDYHAIKTETNCLLTPKTQSAPRVDNVRLQNCGQSESPKTDITSGPNNMTMVTNQNWQKHAKSDMRVLSAHAGELEIT